MTDEEAKKIIRDYHRGSLVGVNLQDYIDAVSFYAENHPDATMIDMQDWAFDMKKPYTGW